MDQNLPINKMNERKIVTLIENDKEIMEILSLVKSLDLPDSWVGGGILRSLVWDYLHGYTKKTKVSDVDVIYYDPLDFKKEEIGSYSTQKEKELEEKLSKLSTKHAWSVTNQARMHIYHNRGPYKNSKEALSDWVETATAIAAQLTEHNKVIFTAYYGIDDLVNLRLRPVSFEPERLAVFRKRITGKKWLEKWPKLSVVL